MEASSSRPTSHGNASPNDIEIIEAITAALNRGLKGRTQLSNGATPRRLLTCGGSTSIDQGREAAPRVPWFSAGRRRVRGNPRRGFPALTTQDAPGPHRRIPVRTHTVLTVSPP